jgi:DNA-binding CsgD family transcriptional regulator
MRAGPLTERETDDAHLHPYFGERALAALGSNGRAVAALVLRHHERLDGSGYHRSAMAPDLSPAARVLAAASVMGGISGLTAREMEVLRLIAGGRTAKEAARELGISPKTADNHIQNLYAKIGVTTRAGAALFALERGLLQHESMAA